MRFARVFGAAAFALGWVTEAGAQSNSPTPASGDGIIHLHMPGVNADSGSIHLHPIRHGAPADTTGELPVANHETPASATEALAPRSTPARIKAPRSGVSSGKSAIPFSFGENDAPTPSDTGQAPSAPQPQLKTASIPPRGNSPSHGTPSDNEHAGLTKRGAVMFEKGATNPSPAQFNGVKLLAGDLSTALESGASRIQLEAYGGVPGDKSSDARRLSLRRALAVRQLLIDNGVPSNRIDVRAMGGVDDKGPTDRVDVFLRAG